MYLVKSPLMWTRLSELTAGVPEMPRWMSLTELPLKHLTSGPGAAPAARVFYMPQQMPVTPRERAQLQLAA